MDEQDYGVFLSYLKEYLSPREEDEWFKQLAKPNISSQEKDKILKLLRLNNFYQNIELLAYCLMPNHFHFLLKQRDSNAIDRFMNSLSTRYTMYFNRKNERIGPLCQDRYKAVLVKDESQFLHLTRYIHGQALNLQGSTPSENYPCSYGDYIGTRSTGWVHPEEVLTFFNNNYPSFSYEAFVADNEIIDKQSKYLLKDITFD